MCALLHFCPIEDLSSTFSAHALNDPWIALAHFGTLELAHFPVQPASFMNVSTRGGCIALLKCSSAGGTGA
jgi:hypothetical protein